MSLMPIGAFARLARLTVEAVRHYDAEGLLVPASVDPRSGYRYYRSDQVRTATTIALLRGLDVPLPVVREVLAAPDEKTVAAVLAAQREHVAAEMARREQVLRSLDALLLAPRRVRYDVGIAERAPLWLVGLTGRVRADALDVDAAALCAAVLRTGAGNGREPLVGVFPLDLVDEFDAAVGVPAPPGTSEVAVALPGGPWAATLHVGPYEELPLAYTAVLEHVRERGHQVRGPVTETYLTDPGTVAPDELVTRVSLALEP
ncbi:MerR family transcriptional regulator [Pseudonocardia xinjiangensis]|uniref:MerR family transcriptional regulator n=1 Tax=Pseudonocardia xinjiangensis TaxID=75289 RepID=A0ABX1RNW2_9PSEU|nr:MerR family transcriptional regulator [Pseudonocardia xinjiangensis]NMH80780.1 MerR family transcriptional regulator [Pseudonocardia xinjiangensis]